jgi:hypothetical protein
LGWEHRECTRISERMEGALRRAATDAIKETSPKKIRAIRYIGWPL